MATGRCSTLARWLGRQACWGTLAGPDARCLAAGLDCFWGWLCAFRHVPHASELRTVAKCAIYDCLLFNYDNSIEFNIFNFQMTRHHMVSV